jgi:hypothetical protein
MYLSYLVLWHIPEDSSPLLLALYLHMSHASSKDVYLSLVRSKGQFHENLSGNINTKGTRLQSFIVSE